MSDRAPATEAGASSLLDLARTGRAALWRYLLGLLLIGLLGYVVAIVPMLMVLIAAVELGVAVDWATLETADPLVDFVALNATFPTLFLAVPLVVWLIHRRPVRTVVTASSAIRWPRIIQGAAVWLALLVVLTAVDVAFNPGVYRLTFEPARWLILVALALLMTPIQTTAEELLFRGYLLQLAGRIFRNRYVVAAIPAALFALMHAANPEFWHNPSVGWIPYLAMGLVWTAATVRDEGMEVAIGAHLANNLFVFLLVEEVGSTAQVGAILTRVELDPVGTAISAVVTAIAFWLILFVLPARLRSRRTPSPVPALATE